VVIVSEDGALPAVMAIVRGAFGRHAWTMQLRHHSRSRKVSPSVCLYLELTWWHGMLKVRSTCGYITSHFHSNLEG